MSDDLVKRLRDVAGVIIGAQSQNLEEDYGLAREAADRIEKLEKENGVLFVANVRLNSRTDLDCDHYCDRIEQLEAALKEIAADYETEWSTSTFTNMMDVAKILSERINTARKALEGKDD